MTDTDDTDVLLHTPADYYITSFGHKMPNDEKPKEQRNINGGLRPFEYVETINFSMHSDISSITTSTGNGKNGCSRLRDDCVNRLMQSTPKSKYRQKAREEALESDNRSVLSEIDRHLLEQHKNVPSKSFATPNKMIDSNTSNHASPYKSKLISLSELWCTQEQPTAIRNYSNTQSALVEEQFRRQHLERTVQSLQARQLEYEQRLTVALEVDRTKDAALKKAQEECKCHLAERQNLRNGLHRLENEKLEQDKKLERFEKELSQAISLATKFQSNSEKIEFDLNIKKEQVVEQKQEIENLELKINASKRAEEMANKEVQKLQDKLAKVEYDNEKLKTLLDQIQRDTTIIREQKSTLEGYHQKQKTRADQLEARLKSQDCLIEGLKNSEASLKRKLEMQQKTMKAHFQQQLENVVAQKLAQFQEELDQREETLRAEARERERLIAERAMKQLEKINETNNKENKLLLEKHEEEIQLYRLQQANAAKRIEQLEQNLLNYKSKRSEIAERLHSVMEMQWKKALEILTSPSHSKEERDAPALSDENNKNNFETPKSRNLQRHISECSNTNMTSKNEPVSPMDRLQAYIEYLLSKSPKELDSFDITLNSSIAKQKLNTNKNRREKPPWKS